MVLRASGEAAHTTGSRFVEVGGRSLAEALHRPHHRAQPFESENDPLITRMEQGRGTKGDLYMLAIPEDVKQASKTCPGCKGKIHAVRPVFRELGMPAALRRLIAD
ncbi:hypothetical protein NicSoilE8_38210 [Arthrobacter sp. NicSoilE8]|nr:hypothetical protein NicSoilE8_38210 [Arthrobacter sp. NicSoilE8]